MHREMTLKQRIGLCLAAFFVALAAQIFLSFYQSGTVLRELDDQMGNFNAISRFQNGVQQSLNALESYRWEYGDAGELLDQLHSSSSVMSAWLWRIEGDLGTVSEEQYLLYSAVCTTYDSYKELLDQLEEEVRMGRDAARAVLAQRPACRVIFVTAYSLFQYAHEAVHLGACDYLLKPVDPDELEASIRRAMRQIEAERKLEELARTTELSPEPETPEVPENPEEGAPEAESPEGENSQTAMVMTQVRRYLEDNYMFDLSLDSVGEILHISPAYLSAQFKKYQKMNFLDCLTELRINAAKELLADPFRSSAEVASMVGYEDASYFARAFKKRTGMTPTQYRRQAGKKSAEAHL